MLSTALIVFREVLEAALIVGILLTATEGVATRGRWISFGLGAGLIGACIIAVFAEAIAEASEGMGQEIFNAGVLFAATAMLAWHNLWMARHGRELATRMKTVGQGVGENSRPLYMLSIVIALAVLREGSEVVLFTYGIAAAGTGTLPMLGGGLLGIAFGTGVGAALYFGLLRIPTRYLFTATAWLIVLLAAGMASQASAYLIQAGVLHALKPVLWDTSMILSEHSLLGEMLHTLVGYDDRPSAMQFLVYIASIIIVGAMTLAASKPVTLRAAGTTAVIVVSVVVTLSLISIPAHAAQQTYCCSTVDRVETKSM